MKDLPTLLTEKDVIDLGVDPLTLTVAGTYYTSRDGTKKLVGEPLYRSSDIDQAFETLNCADLS